MLAEMKRKRVEPTVVLGEVVRVVCDMLSVRLMTDEGLTVGEIASRLKLHEFRVTLCLNSNARVDRLKRLLEMSAEADSALKQTLSSHGYEAIERLICSL